ncbi:MAG: PBECR4 domain-containing protein [Lachnospiraceae bacterium]|nr:PBECR4 domain-containing protein [Lachnospiraceae bacterium]
MSNIYDCVNSFISLLNTRYHLILGRKGVSVSLQVEFTKNDCFHLMGLQYLTDRPELKRNRAVIFDEIRDHIIKRDQIESSDFYPQICDRIRYLPMLEELFDKNDTIFKYNQKRNLYSMIEADYLMKNKLENRALYIFLSQNKDGNYFCRSFFPETKMDYTKNQALWTLLYKSKIHVSNGEEIILYDRWNKNN